MNVLLNPKIVEKKCHSCIFEIKVSLFVCLVHLGPGSFHHGRCTFNFLDFFFLGGGVARGVVELFKQQNLRSKN